MCREEKLQRQGNKKHRYNQPAHQEEWLQVKRKGGKGGATRSNLKTSQGKQKLNRRWEVEVARQRQEAGTCQEDEQRRWCDERQHHNQLAH
jgi:hypothetical protein